MDKGHGCLKEEAVFSGISGQVIEKQGQQMELCATAMR